MSPTEPKTPLDKANEYLWNEIKSGFMYADEWSDYEQLSDISKQCVRDALAETGFYELVEYVNAAAAIDSYFVNGMPPYVNHDELVTRLRAAHKDLWDVPGVILDPFYDEEMWNAIFTKGEAP